jgi:concentrative nucleoside transporter, CNT family
MISFLLEHHRYLNIFGIITVLAIATVFSKHRRHISWRLVVTALLMQLGIAFLVLKTQRGNAVISYVADMVARLYQAAELGIQFLFGNLTNPAGEWGFIFAIRVLPIIIFFGAVMSVLFYLGVIQKAVGAVAFVVRPLLGTTGSETLCAIANSFLGQTEAPLLIRHYLKDMTASEVLVVMVSGMGTISGAILAVYANMGVPAVHLLAASVMAIPATILIAKILYPETERTKHATAIADEPISSSKNILDALASGTSDGLMLTLNVGAMLLAFIACIGLVNNILGWSCIQLQYIIDLIHLPLAIPCLTIQQILGYIFAPFGYLMGLEGSEIFAAGTLIGLKVGVNEMIAFREMLSMNLSPRTVSLLTYALCGFSNFSCIGIQLGGIGALAPSKRAILSELGIRAVFGAMLANLLSAFIAGLLL